MKRKEQKSPFKWSIQRQFTLYILLSTVTIMGLVFGLSMLSRMWELERNSGAPDRSVENSVVLQPPIKGLFQVPTLKVDQNGGHVGFEMNSETARFMYDLKQTIIEDYQKVFLISFSALIFLQLLISYFFVKHKFIRPLEEASEDIVKLVNGGYGLDEKAPSSNEIIQLKHHIFKLAQTLEQSEKFRKMSEQQRKTLIAGLSHDLKTPLTNIIGYSETLQMNDEMSDEGKAYLEIIHRNAVVANQMIGNITNANRLDKTETQRTLVCVDIAQVFNTCADDFREAAKRNNQMIDADFIEGDTLITDAELLRRLFNNLLQNFVNHSGKDTQLLVTSHDEQEALQIVFKDNGVGVPKHLVPRLTELMYKVDDARGERENSGIGLYNVLKITEMLKGSLEIESDVGKGMSVVLRLPKLIDSDINCGKMEVDYGSYNE